jgi:hypothetical protein
MRHAHLSQANNVSASCACGRVTLQAFGAPITSVVCYCDDCQRGSRQIESLPNAAHVLEPDGGTPYILYRKDRVHFLTGADLLTNHKIREDSASSRVVASCCNSAMVLRFDDKRHWVSMYRARFAAPAMPLQMRICTKFKPNNGELADDLPNHPGYPLKFLTKLLVAWIPMLLGR